MSTPMEPDFWATVEQLQPDAWCRQEVWRLQKLLGIHVELGLETGTDPRRIVALLKEVRRSVLQVLPREAA